MRQVSGWSRWRCPERSSLTIPLVRKKEMASFKRVFGSGETCLDFLDFGQVLGDAFQRMVGIDQILCAGIAATLEEGVELAILGRIEGACTATACSS